MCSRIHTPRPSTRLRQASYATSDAVPPSPAEPPAADPPAPPARPFPWLPSTEEEDGPSDWYRQNLQAWEAGTRLPGGHGCGTGAWGEGAVRRERGWSAEARPVWGCSAG